MIHNDNDDLEPSTTPGYKPAGLVKSVEEYAKLDAEDESLARWKASLGITIGSSVDTSGPRLTVLTLELHSSTLTKAIVLNLNDPTKMAEIKNKPITIKEGIDYTVRITFKVNHSIVSGVHYIQVVKRAGINVHKLERMLGSFSYRLDEPVREAKFEEESPLGVLARTGVYQVRSRVVDEDKTVFAEWEWSFKIAKEW